MLADLSLVGCYNRTAVGAYERDLLMLTSAKDNLRRMAFFGLTERQQRSQRLFERTFRLRFLRPFAQLNETRSTAAFGQVGPEELEAVKRLNHLDMQLYEYAKKLMDDRIRRLQATQDPLPALTDELPGAFMSHMKQGRIYGVGPYGFEWPEDFDYASYDEFQENYHTVLAKRLKKWEHLLRRPRPIKRSRQLKRYVRKGVPQGHRKQVWMVLSGAAALQAQNQSQYKSLLESTLQQDLVETIQIDVPRTFPDNIYFHNGTDGKQVPLFNVLVAHAHLDQGVGYCQ
ncbi:hypothetical protein HPB47_026484, partial [Ixodes persulcatus]